MLYLNNTIETKIQFKCEGEGTRILLLCYIENQMINVVSITIFQQIAFFT